MLSFSCLQGHSHGHHHHHHHDHEDPKHKYTKEANQPAADDKKKKADAEHHHHDHEGHDHGHDKKEDQKSNQHSHEHHDHKHAHHDHKHAHHDHTHEHHDHTHDKHDHHQKPSHSDTPQPKKKQGSGVMWLEALLSTSLISAAPFFILFFVPLESNSAEHQPLLKILLSFASGGLLGDAFLHLIPHAISPHVHGAEGHSHSHGHAHSHGHSHHHEGESHETGHDHSADMIVGLWVLAGIVAFLMVEKFVRYVKGGHGHSHSHGHGHSHDAQQENHPDGEVVKDKEDDKSTELRQRKKDQGNYTNNQVLFSSLVQFKQFLLKSHIFCWSILKYEISSKKRQNLWKAILQIWLICHDDDVTKSNHEKILN